MKQLLIIIATAFCLVSIGQAADACMHPGASRADIMHCQELQYLANDVECLESEEIVDPIISACELSDYQHQVRWSSANASPFSGFFCGAYLTSTPRYLLVRRLLI